MSSSASEAEEDNTPEDEQISQIFGYETKQPPPPKPPNKRGGRGGRGRGRGGGGYSSRARGAGRGRGGQQRFEPYQRPATAEAEDDAQDAAARQEEQALQAAMNAANGGGGLDGEDAAPRPMDEMEVKQQSALGEFEKRMYLDHRIDWDRVLEEDKKLAEQKADELGLPPESDERREFMIYDEKDQDRCISCRNQGKLQNNDPYCDLNAFMNDNYTPDQLPYCITGVRDLYLEQFMPQRKTDPNVKFWYRKIIYDHILVHRPLPLTEAENDLHRVNMSIGMATHSQLKRDEFTGQKVWDPRISPAMSKLYELKLKLEDKVQKLRKSVRSYF